MTAIRITIAIYAAAAVFTFGHAMNNDAIDNKDDLRPMVATFACVVWPLYWSWQLQIKS